jgi:hypothetical protein
VISALGFDSNRDALVIRAWIFKRPNIMALAVLQAPNAYVLESHSMVVANTASRPSHIRAAKEVGVANTVTRDAEIVGGASGDHTLANQGVSLLDASTGIGKRAVFADELHNIFRAAGIGSSQDGKTDGDFGEHGGSV